MSKAKPTLSEEMALNRAVWKALLRNNFKAFTHKCFQTVAPGQPMLWNWHLDALCHSLELCRRGEIRRLIVTLPPRNGKSITTSVAWPAWALAQDPRIRIVCASYSQDLSTKHARDFRLVMQSPWYRSLFPGTRIDPRKNTEAEIETTARGGRLTTSVGGTLTGRGGNLIIIDDPLKPEDAMSPVKRGSTNDWFDRTLSTRLDDKTKDAIVLIMQRVHDEDLVGHVFEQGGDWTVLELPAIAEEDEEIEVADGVFHFRRVGELLHPEREPLWVLKDLERTLGSQAFSAQYQQAPIPSEGALIKRVWLPGYGRLPKRRPQDRVAQSWDTGTKSGPTNDYSVCTTWLIHGKDYYLLDVYRDRLDYPDLKRAVQSLAAKYKPNIVLIEDAGTGTSLIQQFRRERTIRPIGIRPDRDKITRLASQTHVIEAGRVRLPQYAPWLDVFINEILAFPGGRKDDQVDSLSQFLIWAERNQARQWTSRLTLAGGGRLFTVQG